MAAPLSVHVWSDIACPWCFLGKRRFDRAVREFGGEVAVEYHSFELSPDTPVDFDGDEVDFLAGHKGMSRADAQRMLEQMAALAATEGLRYDFHALRHTKTLLAHQAIQYAKAEGLQEPMVERLFQAYFEQGRHVGRVDELVALASEVGLDPQETGRVLAEGVYAAAVAEDIAIAQEAGINGVPFYVIDGRYGVSGAQSSEVFGSALHRAAADRAAADRAASDRAAADRAAADGAASDRAASDPAASDQASL
jgi:predicted DsbA family dithiol-disulfide isomerase